MLCGGSTDDVTVHVTLVSVVIYITAPISTIITASTQAFLFQSHYFLVTLQHRTAASSNGVVDGESTQQS